MDNILAVLLLFLPSITLQQTPSSSDSTPSTVDCMTAPLASEYLEWQGHVTGSSINVEWGYGNMTCSSMNTCFGLNLPNDVPLEPQIRPIQTQKGVEIRFHSSPNMDIIYTIQPFLVDEIGFRSCNFTRGRPVMEEGSSSEFIVPATYIKTGSNYFIVNTSDPLYDCRYGLRLNLTVKQKACSGVGETVYCWNRGRCVTSFLTTQYECDCCQGYTGPYCEDHDACISAPCQNGGHCIHGNNDVTGNNYSCQCLLGYYGNQCESRVDNLCEIDPCENKATCEGNLTSYTCHCSHGYTGHHCEVNNNNCASRPCVHGVCVDKVGGHQCYCTPGYGGSNCDHEFDECISSPCRNDGFCINGPDGYECQCSQGYTGENCAVKVDLCDPSPCYNATECVDFGHSYECTCIPGFTGYHCEVNINECASDPCMNGGKCRDVISGYMCVCPEDVSGIHCEYKRMNLPRLFPESSYLGDRSSPHPVIHHLYIVAGTLAGALLIALSVLVGCYCRMHETYKVLCHRREGYARHTEETLREKKEACGRQMANQSLDPGPSMDAILEVSGCSYDSTQDTQLVNSLKPKRV